MVKTIIKFYNQTFIFVFYKLFYEAKFSFWGVPFLALGQISILPYEYSKETLRLIEVGRKVHRAWEISVSARLLLQMIPCVKSGWTSRLRETKSQDERPCQDTHSHGILSVSRFFFPKAI